MLRFCLLAASAALIGGSTCAAADCALADAAEACDFAKVRALVEQKADVSAAQPDGMTALHWAAHHGAFGVTRQLLAAGADVKAVNRYGVTPLSLACIRGDNATVEVLLEAGADANTSLPGGETALMTAARTGRLGPVKALLSRGADVNAKEQKGQTALMWAAAEGHVEVVDALLEAGADSRTPLPSGFTPLFFAVREGKTPVVLRLLEAGSDINEVMRSQSRGGSSRGRPTTPLLIAIENGHFELASELLKRGADANAKPAGFTALHAITWVRKPIRGDGDPPPYGSGKLESPDIVRQLVAYGADINARLEKGTSGRGRYTTTGTTPFGLAARASDVPLMKLLLELGADPKIPNEHNCSPLLAAAGVGALGDGDEAAGTNQEAVEAVRLLLDLGLDINAVDDNGETVMHGAAYQERPEVVELLAARGADINVWNRKNKAGWTPLMTAQGHRPGNFRPSPLTIAAIEKVMLANGLTPPKAERPVPRYGFENR